MNKKPLVIAIAGGTCSGKSTLTDILTQKFMEHEKVKVFNMDSYFKTDPPKVIAPITGDEYVEHNHPDALEKEKLQREFMKALEEDWDIIIIEGLFALHMEQYRNAADIKIFVDLKSDERLARRITKHMAWGQTFEQVTLRYLDTVRFRHDELVEPSRWHADIIINGTMDANRGAEFVATMIREELKNNR